MQSPENDFEIINDNSDTKETSYGMKTSSLINETKPNQPEEASNKKNKQIWICPICFDDLNEPVVTLCGHVYCWTCIYPWYTTKNPSTELFWTDDHFVYKISSENISILDLT